MFLKLNLLAWYDHLASREKRVFQGAMACFIILLVDMTVITPILDSYSAMDERIASSERTLIRNLVNIQRKESVEAEYEKYRPFVRPSGSDEEENASLLSGMEELARANQVVLVDMKPQEVKAHQYHKAYVAELDAEADMANLIGFLHAIGESPLLMKVTNVRISPKDIKDPKSTVIKARITVMKTVLLGGT